MAVAQDIARTQERPAPAFWTIARRDSLAGFLFIAPQLIGIVIFVLIPLGLVFWYSLHEWNVLANTFTYTGAQNYRMLVEDSNLRDVLGATAIFSAGLVVFNLSLALLLAVLLNQKLAGIAIFRTLFFSPVVVSLVAWTIVWGFLLQKNGGINGMLLMAGIEGPNWLREETTAMISVIVVQVFKNVGLNMILFLAALQGVPKELYEAARIDGAPAFKQFRRITLPLISPTILLTSIITIVGSLQVFAQIAVLTQGGAGSLDHGAGLLPLSAGLPVSFLWLRLDAVHPAVCGRRRTDLRPVANAQEDRLL
ncbi:sugar ABC transporter permease [Rhizobium pusense]|nr:sugar ABC transporter permease [Agrobacterium pusense]MDH0873923.1 sugar ABC transporter permease [Agrobacterium pusense]MDH1096426.1 sugar ABC transporter permease [Agrobacterium pusense]